MRAGRGVRLITVPDIQSPMSDARVHQRGAVDKVQAIEWWVVTRD